MNVILVYFVISINVLFKFSISNFYSNVCKFVHTRLCFDSRRVFCLYLVFCTFRNILGFETVYICWKSFNDWVTDIYSELVMFTFRSGKSNKDVSVGWYSELLCIFLFFVIVWLKHCILVSFASATLNEKCLWFAYQERSLNMQLSFVTCTY